MPTLKERCNDRDEGGPDSIPDEALDSKGGTLSREGGLPVHQGCHDSNTLPLGAVVSNREDPVQHLDEVMLG